MSDSTKILSSNVVLVQERTGRQIQLHDGFTVGRTEGNESFPKDGGLSRVHFKLSLYGTSLTIEDLKSTNGTRVNGQRIKAGEPVVLKLGDRIDAGGQVFHVREPGKTPAAAYVPAQPKALQDQVSAAFWRSFKEYWLGTPMLRGSGWDYAFWGLAMIPLAIGVYQRVRSPDDALAATGFQLQLYFIVGTLVAGQAFHLTRTLFLKTLKTRVPAFVALLALGLGIPSLHLRSEAIATGVAMGQAYIDCVQKYDAGRCATHAGFVAKNKLLLPPKFLGPIEEGLQKARRMPASR
jgi:hypothetical protein